MKRFLAITTVILLSTTPALAKHHHHHHHKGGSQGAAGLGANGVTDNANSSPTMKTGAHRSPTGGAPTH